VVLARALDGIVVVVAANNTPRKVLEGRHSTSSIHLRPSLGIAFNETTAPLCG
jgi:hypothetical protein